MKKIILFASLVPLLLLWTACSLNLPYEDYEYTGGYTVLLRVDPDDAEVLLNGRLVGMAYEFSTGDSALRLASRNNELVIKKQGYAEEAINLRDYSSHRITVTLSLKPERRSPNAPATATAKEKDAYLAKTEPVKELPPLAAQAKPEIPGPEPVQVILDVTPVESAIYISGVFWGIVPESGKIDNLRLKPGKYLLEIIKPGYKPYSKEITATKEKLALKVECKRSDRFAARRLLPAYGLSELLVYVRKFFFQPGKIGARLLLPLQPPVAGNAVLPQFEQLLALPGRQE